MSTRTNLSETHGFNSSCLSFGFLTFTFSFSLAYLFSMVSNKSHSFTVFLNNSNSFLFTKLKRWTQHIVFGAIKSKLNKIRGTIKEGGRHCGAVASTVASQQESHWFNSDPGLSAWSLQVLSVSARVLSRYCGFL